MNLLIPCAVQEARRLFQEPDVADPETIDVNYVFYLPSNLIFA